jgi:23S rRNA (cytosine1962-C5)-methyltransferase
MLEHISLPKTLAVKLTSKAEKHIKKGHPWVYSDSIVKINVDAKSGDVCILFDSKSNAVYAVGLYDASSPIRIKIIERAATKLNLDFLKQKISIAFQKRKSLLAGNTNSYRLVYGENDFLPGIIADVYDSVLVLKIYSEAWIPYLEILKEAFAEIPRVKTIVLRCSRLVEKNKLGKKLNGTVMYGVLENEEVVFVEHGVRFSANVIKGHKTGFFLDHRPNRKRVGELSQGKTVLDVFAYAGGFSIHALVGGATEVTSVDISEQALAIAKQNAQLNHFKGKYTTISGDAFEVLKDLIKKGKQYDVVVIDPPSFAKSKEEVFTALKKYTELATLGTQLVAAKGVLLLASCSSRVNLDEFLETHQTAFKRAQNQFDLIEVTKHDIDHPIAIEEAAYLKSVYYKRK